MPPMYVAYAIADQPADLNIFVLIFLDFHGSSILISWDFVLYSSLGIGSVIRALILI